MSATQAVSGWVERTFRCALRDGRCAINVVVRQSAETPCRVHAVLPVQPEHADQLRSLLPPGQLVTLAGDYLSPMLDTLDMMLARSRLVFPLACEPSAAPAAEPATPPREDAHAAA